MTNPDQALSAALAQIDQAFGKDAPPYTQTRPASMTESVARELCRQRLIVAPEELPSERLNQLVDEHWRTFIDRARDVFAAMSVPTEEMLDDVEGWQPKDAYEDLPTERERIEFIWQVMIDCAEAEFSEETLARQAKQAEWDAMTPEQQRANWAEWEAKNGNKI